MHYSYDDSPGTLIQGTSPYDSEQMWTALIDYFQRFPAQEKIARLLIRNGLSIKGGAVYSGDIQLSDSALGRAAGVDRRIVSATVRTIEANPELHKVFSN